MKRLIIENPKWTMIALAAVMAIALLAGWQPAHADLMLAGVAGLPMALGSTVGTSEIKELVVAQGEAWKEHYKKSEERLSALEGNVLNVQKAMARPSFGMGGGDSLSFSTDDTAYKSSFLGWMRSGREGDLEAKAMSIGADPDGGYLVPKQLDAELTKVLRELSPMRQIARVVKADTSDYSMIHSVGGTGYSWVGEKSDRPETDSPTFQKITPPIGEIYANPGVTQAMLDDAGFNIEEWIVQELSESFDAGEGDAFVNGSGINKPRGFLTYDIASTADGSRDNTALQYVASGASGAFAASAPSDKLVQLVHSLRPRYRRGASWLMNTDTLSAIRQMKDASGRYYLWQPSLDANMPETILGYPVYECSDMPDISSNSLSIAFGNFGIGYTIVDRTTLMLRDPYSNKPYVHFYSSRRVGGAVRDTRAIKLLKFAAS